MAFNKHVVIPAQAGIHHLHSNSKKVGLTLLGRVMDSRLRGNDEAYILYFECQYRLTTLPNVMSVSYGAVRGIE
jgi:hypothetical protein